jgi:hypothetical protein
MEKPTVDPTTGEAQWRPDGARQRFAKRLSEEVDIERVLVAAGSVMRDLMEQRGEIGPDDAFSPDWSEIADWISWLNLGQLKRLRRLAEDLIVEEVSVN